MDYVRVEGFSRRTRACEVQRGHTAIDAPLPQRLCLQQIGVVVEGVEGDQSNDCDVVRVKVLACAGLYIARGRTRFR